MAFLVAKCHLKGAQEILFDDKNKCGGVENLFSSLSTTKKLHNIERLPAKISLVVL
jgi:hypothetical protein